MLDPVNGVARLLGADRSRCNAHWCRAKRRDGGALAGRDHIPDTVTAARRLPRIVHRLARELFTRPFSAATMNATLCTPCSRT
jgi:hypothetical protein